MLVLKLVTVVVVSDYADYFLGKIKSTEVK